MVVYGGNGPPPKIKMAVSSIYNTSEKGENGEKNVTDHKSNKSERRCARSLNKKSRPFACKTPTILKF